MSLDHYQDYARRLSTVLEQQDWRPVASLGEDLQWAWRHNKQVFLCGNGGSAANAIHLANDFMYGASRDLGIGLRVHAMPANQAVLTCLANDIGYDDIFSHQIAVLGEAGDLLIALSGSGNSPNIIKALHKAREIGLKSYAILGYSGGQALKLADQSIHFPIDDMQIAENCQQIVGHMVMRWLVEHGKGEASAAP